MEIEKVVGCVDDRPQRAGARQLHRLPRPVEHRGAPQTIEVLVDIAGRNRVAGVEFPISGDVVERQGQLTPARLKPGTEQSVDGDCATDLITVGQRTEDDVWPRLGSLERSYVLNPG